MMLVLFSLLGMSVEAPGTVWLDAYELQGGTVTLPSAATYSVWLWASGGGAAQVTLGGEAFQALENASSKGSFHWVKAGEAELPAGPVEIALEGNIASVALSSDAGFHPEKAQPCMRVFDQPEVPLDGRYNLPRDTDATFCMTSFASREDWEAYAAALRRTILVSSALWPMPERTPLNVHIEPAAEHDDYLIEKVYFESRPGVLVTGNLYRPKGEGPFPGVACPHGHWNAGRLGHEPLGSVPARCITLARMGMVAFSYDMVGYVDSLQFPNHGWEDPVHKLYGLHPFAFQLWNSMRVVDFLASLPYVDAGNLACTGASGGGTQTFALQAVEPRIKVSAPVNMISHTMQGGCMCENAPILRMRASNMEIGALMAPRPMLMVSTAGDWTRLTPRVEFPAIRGIYAFYDAADRVENKHFDYPHNYNEDSRTAMYRFFGKWVLNQGARYETFTEPPFEKDPDEVLRVFPDGQLPDGFGTLDTFMPSVMEATRAKCAAMLPQNPEAREAFRTGYGAALFDILGVTVPEPAQVSARRLGQGDAGGCTFERLIVWRPDCNQAIPAVLYKPQGAPSGAVLAVHSQGKAALADLLAGGPGALVRAQLAAGNAVLCIDTFLTGEYQHPRTGSSRKTFKFPDTFLPTDTAFRIHDIVTAAVFLRAETGLPVTVTGLGGAGVWALFAAAVEPAIAGVVADTAGFDPSSDAQWVEKHYLPCIRSVGDLNTVAAMIAPRPVELIHCADPGLWSGFQRAYANAAGTDGALTMAGGAGSTAASE
jgi:dienelactone hydrolase